jgi:hypothetical protein
MGRTEISECVFEFTEYGTMLKSHFTYKEFREQKFKLSCIIPKSREISVYFFNRKEIMAI